MQEIYTGVKASPGFWEKLIMNQINVADSLKFLQNKTDAILIKPQNQDTIENIISPKACLRATKLGTTFINVDLLFLDRRPNELQKKNDKDLNEAYLQEQKNNLY